MADKSKAITIERDEAVSEGLRLRDEVIQAHGDQSSYIAVVKANRELLKDEQPLAVADKKWEGCSEIVVPFIKQAKLALLAHLCPVLLGPDPVLHVEGTDEKSRDTSDELENYQQAQLIRQCGYIPRMKRGIDAALRDGTAIFHQYWKTEKAILPTHGGERETVIYDAPFYEFIEIDKFCTFPAANVDMQESPGASVRFAQTGARIQQLADAGYYDSEKAAELLGTSPDDNAQLSADSETKGIQTSSPSKSSTSSYTLTQIYYRDILGSDKALRDWHIVIDEASGIVLRFRPTPWFHGKRPFHAITPYLSPSGVAGESLATSGAMHTQAALRTLTRLAIDAVAMGVFPEIIAPASIGPDGLANFSKRRKPGGVIPMTDAFLEGGGKLQMLGNGGYSPSLLLPFLQHFYESGSKQLGASDNMQSGAIPGNTTATEALQIQEGATKITAYLTENIGETLAQMGEMSIELNRQFQGNDGPKKLWEEVNAGRKVTLKKALAGNYRVVASGVRDTQNKAILAKRATERLDAMLTLLQHPSGIGAMLFQPENVHAVTSDFFQAGGSDPSRYIVPLEEMLKNVQAAQQQAAQVAQQPAQPPVEQGMPPELQQAILQLAQQQGVPPEQLIQQIMQQAQSTGQPPEAIVQQMLSQTAPPVGGSPSASPSAGMMPAAAPQGGMGSASSPDAIPPEMQQAIVQLAQMLGITPEELIEKIVMEAQRQGVDPLQILQQLIAEAQGGQG